MSSWLKFYYKLFNLLLSICVKSKVIPINPILEYKIDSARPIIYILPYDSKADLLTLRLQCIKYGLPDPLTMLEIDGICLPRYIFIHNGPRIFSYFVPNNKFVKLFNNYLELHHNKPQFDIQILQVLVMFGRGPERNIQKDFIPSLRMLNGIQKFFSILWYGRDSFVYFSPIVSLHHIANKNIKDNLIATKLAQSAHVHFSRQQLASIGPCLPARRDIFNKILHLKSISKAIEDEVRNKKISHKIAQKNAMKIMKEIAANFSYETIRITDRIMGWLWSYLYQGMQINGIERVRQLAQNGHEIIYIPCHRSHMDYLLLSYVIYNQGLVPPYIVAGINLNFWPVGPILCRLGAIFIRRNFKNHKLYALIFREYLIELFSKGYSIEYFIEGSRSRTGRLLTPKTGTLSMTIQTMIRGGIRPITFIPVYIGYEHIIEVSTYNKELLGKKKKKEGFLQMIRSICNLSKLGQSCINFGKPLLLLNYLNKKVPEWHKVINEIESHRPIWMTPIINDIANLLMVRINAAGAINAMNLCVTALLSADQQSLSREQLIKQLECYTQLLSNVPYSSEVTLLNIKPEALLNQAISMNKFETEQDTNIGEIIILPRKHAILMTYYRNNIHHMLAIPSLIAIIVQQYREISKSELLRQVILIYPMLKNELFLHWNKSDLPTLLHNLLNELVRQGLILIEGSQLKLSVDRYITLKLLASGIREILQRFAIIFSILKINPTINRTSLKKQSCELAQHLSVLYGIHAPEFFDKSVFTTLIATLQDEGYISNQGISNVQNVYIMYDILAKLVTNDVCFAIESLLIHK